MKNGSFEWTEATQRAIESIKGSFCSIPILVVPHFELLFEVECDASGTRISAVVTQAKCALAYFNEKWGGSRLNYSIYDKVFYVIVKALEH